MSENGGSGNFSGAISMNPEKLYNIALNGVDLESRVNANFLKLDEVFSGLIDAVQTPELNTQLKSLYDTFRKVENDFDRNSQIINKFFESQLQDYNKHAQNIIESTTSLSNSIDNKTSDENTNNNESTKVYTYTEEDGLKEATNVGYISDDDLMNDTAFGASGNSN